MVAQAAQRTAPVRQARRINGELARLYPDTRTELNFARPLELLAAILSAQTTDRKVNEVTRVLFARYRTAAHSRPRTRRSLRR
jgi:endonuclease-3